MQLSPRVNNRGSLHIRDRALRWGERTYLMGIVNVTPDSFSGDGIEETDLAAAYGVVQLERGSDILDIGAESTRPGHQPVSAKIEQDRLLPVIAEIRRRLPSAFLSADTYKPDVLRAAQRAGADILNSVWGLPDELLAVAAELEMPVVAMHNKTEATYAGSVMDDVLRFLENAGQRAVAAGIPREHVMLDPGIGFGKTADQNIEVLRWLDRLPALGFPTVLGTSRKSTIGKLTGREPGDRAYGTAATTALAVAAGIDIVRVHDVSEARDVVRVADAIVRDWRPDGWI